LGGIGKLPEHAVKQRLKGSGSKDCLFKVANDITLTRKRPLPRLRWLSRFHPTGTLQLPLVFGVRNRRAREFL